MKSPNLSSTRSDEMTQQEERMEDTEATAEDDNYFDSYEDIEIHRLMLKDVPRTEAYQKAILGNKQLFEGKVVMDIGAGTGILSLFCAQAGAAKVYAVEASRLANLTREVVAKNGFSHVIEVVHGKAEEIDLPEGVQVDVIVSEWMGFYLLHESMLESVLLARDKHLKPDGVMLPSKATLFAAACRLGEFYSQQVDFWNHLYGLDLSPVGQAVLDSKRCKPEVAIAKADELLSEPVQLADFDLAWLGPDEIERIHSRAFTSVLCDQPTEYQGVCLWFDCSFEWPDRIPCTPVKLSTSPSSAATHWKQTIIVLPSSIQVEEGDLIGWELTLKRSMEHRRRYQIELNLLDPEEDEHPVPCSCGQARCVVIAAFMAKADEEPLPDDDVDVSTGPSSVIS
ncbi:protein arginine N-methyltransferase 6 [Daphnia magna]|uniref:protein arginine N-methyltransferase 6 n=1 Tax=Daphnia magna TaxID=35525 RepID=UPI001E1BC09F|nr:protein arginine N-methyltransferase 6 [Daphnia magna]XP_032788478.2 protein arginine N-methyltransferase 6 [Daphnia magna]